MAVTIGMQKLQVDRRLHGDHQWRWGFGHGSPSQENGGDPLRVRLACVPMVGPGCRCRVHRAIIRSAPPVPLRWWDGLFIQEFAVTYTVLIQESDEGFAASVPGLPGCHSQGETEAEALANIRDAIREYLDVVKELAASAGTRQVAVEV